MYQGRLAQWWPVESTAQGSQKKVKRDSRVIGIFKRRGTIGFGYHLTTWLVLRSIGGSTRQNGIVSPSI